MKKYLAFLLDAFFYVVKKHQKANKHKSFAFSESVTKMA